MMRAKQVAELILAGFKHHYDKFQAITNEAPSAFARADWGHMLAISRQRISYYDLRVNETIANLKTRIDCSVLDAPLWLKVRDYYQERLDFHPQAELAETFYNSVFCRLFHRRYFNNNFIFVKTSLQDAPALPVEAEYRSYFPVCNGLKPTIREIILHFDFGAAFVDLERDIRLLLKAFLRQAPDTHVASHQMRFDILKAPFYRGKAAYIIGRVVSKTGIQPFIIPVLHQGKKGLFIDALLTRSSQMRVIFGFARAYFMVETHAPSALVRFLNQLMPSKTRAELYNAIGFHKQGKTEFYRELLSELKNSDEAFTLAPGIPGMVMMVFTLPSFPYVFKVIKDKFSETKPFGRNTVLARYQLVKSHDRVGRMADTLEYSNVALPLSRFPEELLKTLENTIAGSMEIDGDQLVIKHLYIERRMTPLNIYLMNATKQEKREVLFEYGQALKEMISVNIFPGDMLLKNFGVTRHKRVIFYDYDEVQYLTEMNFRAMPKGGGFSEQIFDDGSISVAPQDVFPEQLATFVLANPEYKELLLESHPELLDVEFWRQAQARIHQGRYPNIYPYPQHQRFIHEW